MAKNNNTIHDVAKRQAVKIKNNFKWFKYSVIFIQTLRQAGEKVGNALKMPV